MVRNGLLVGVDRRERRRDDGHRAGRGGRRTPGEGRKRRRGGEPGENRVAAAGHRVVGEDRPGGTEAQRRAAFTGTNPRPVRLSGTQELCGGPLDARGLAGLDALVRDQIMAMKTTFTPGHYRRRVAGVLARRLVQRLFGS